MIFSWLPRNTSSPASAGGTQYEFSLYEIRPEGRNPNDVVLSSQPVFRTTVDYTQLVYGPAEPQLVENMRYAWRARAIDTQGRDAFRNNGYSEVCTFTYGGVDPAFIVGGIEGLQAEGETERSARIWWEKGNFDSYRIHYKKSGQGHEWFTSDLLAKDMDPAKEEGELKLHGLEPDTEYEARAQGRRHGEPGPYTEVVKFRTLPVRVAHCGDPALLPEGGPGEPFREAIKGMAIEVDGMEMVLLEVVHLGDGYYQGLGRVSVDYLGGAAFTTSFDRIFINTDRQVVLGRIDFVTNGVAVMAEEQLAAQEKWKGEREAEDLAVKGNGNEGKDIIFEGVIDSVFVDEKGEIIIIDTEGERFVYDRTIDPVTGEVLPVNIVDGGGNGYVVDGEGKVTKGGSGLGNTPDGTTEEQRSLTGLDSLVYEAIVRRTEANIAVIDSLKEKMHPFIKEIEDIIKKENFYPPRIKGKNNELVGEGISLHIPIVSKPESVKERLSPSVKSIDKARNNLIELDIPIQELKPTIELLYELKEGDPFEEFIADIRNDNNLPENTTERVQYIEELLDQRIRENEE